MEKKGLLNEDEKVQIEMLSRLLGLNLTREQLLDFKVNKKVLWLAWKKPKQTLHSWGISKQKVASLCSRANGLQSYILKRSSSIYKSVGNTF